ncbi:hypothetical protein OIU84_025267 [Salix udensis]|uniref:Uncharacterized protein n=1 Tax=Salix udensis TaxID=889485 RepID=A0AAD6KJ84_9ROSI|nr:hypothetical protein OIU84_025267 [Salix udensis]
MNFLASECSADCESGWTLYLEQSFLSNPSSKRRNKTSSGYCSKGKNSTEEESEEEEDEEEEEEEEEEEDLSMVSDASSGPPQYFNEDESYFNYGNDYFYPSHKNTKLLNIGASFRQKNKENGRQSIHKQDQDLPPFLDDTASSPAFNFSKNNFALSNNSQASMVETVFDYSRISSATHFQGRSTFQDHIGFIHPSLSGNKLQNNQWFEGKSNVW